MGARKQQPRIATRQYLAISAALGLTLTVSLFLLLTTIQNTNILLVLRISILLHFYSAAYHSMLALLHTETVACRLHSMLAVWHTTL